MQVRNASTTWVIRSAEPRSPSQTAGWDCLAWVEHTMQNCRRNWDPESRQPSGMDSKNAWDAPMKWPSHPGTSTEDNEGRKRRSQLQGLGHIFLFVPFVAFCSISFRPTSGSWGSAHGLKKGRMGTMNRNGPGRRPALRFLESSLFLSDLLAGHEPALAPECELSQLAALRQATRLGRFSARANIRAAGWDKPRSNLCLGLFISMTGPAPSK